MIAMPKSEPHYSGTTDTHPATGRKRYRIMYNGRERSVYQRKGESETAFKRRCRQLQKDAMSMAGRDVSRTLPELVEWFIYRADLSPRARQNYRVLLDKHIRPVRQMNNDALEIGPLSLRSGYDWLLANGRSQDLVHKTHKLIRAAYNFALSYELVDRNPTEKMRVRQAKKSEVAYIPPDRVPDFLNAAESEPDRVHMMFYLAIATGARFGELRDLQWSDVDISGRRIRYRGTKTAAADRTALITDETAAKLRQYRGDRAGGLVCPDSKGGKMRNQNVRKRHLIPTLKRAGLEHVTFHGLRHTAVALLFALGANENEILSRFGWTRMPDTYKHFDQSIQAASIRRLSGVV